ncbi:MAG: Two-component response regulator [Chitinophagaceae bacterium]|nr:Two-component response regulator [Chitinophagaceae bacterium]
MKKINCILLIDDNPADNEFHAIKIKKADVCQRVESATSGLKALEYIKKSGEPGQSETYPKPDLIFLDINMPGMNGFEFLEEYNKLDEKLKSKVVIIMLTTSLNPDDEKRALNNKDVTEFQHKPLSVEILKETIEKFF